MKKKWYHLQGYQFYWTADEAFAWSKNLWCPRMDRDALKAQIDLQDLTVVWA